MDVKPPVGVSRDLYKNIVKGAKLDSESGNSLGPPISGDTKTKLNFYGKYPEEVEAFKNAIISNNKASKTNNTSKSSKTNNTSKSFHLPYLGNMVKDEENSGGGISVFTIG